MPTAAAARAALWLACAAFVLCSPAARADRAILALEQTVSGQSNLLRTDSDEQADGSYQVKPSLRLQRARGEIEYELDYAPSYDVYFRTDDIDGMDQYGKAELSYAPTPLSKFHTRSDFAYYRSIRSNNVEGPTGAPEIVPDISGRVFRALSDFGYDHSFSETTLGTAFLGLQAYEYSTPSNTDSVGVGGGVRLLHELGQTLSLGGLVFASHRSFEDQDLEPASSNTVLHGGPTLRWLPLPTYTVEVEFGPAWVLTDRDGGEDGSVSRFRTRRSSSGLQAAAFSGCGQFQGQPLLSECPLVPAGGAAGSLGGSASVDYPPGLRPPSHEDDRLTGFGRVLLRKDMYWGYVSLGYLRAEDASSGNGATTVRDSVTATVWWGTDTTWSLRWRANWNQRETVDELDEVAVVAGPSGIPVPGGGGASFAEAESLLVVGDSRPRINQFWTDVTVRRPITNTVSVELGGRYLLQDRSDGDFSDDAGGDYDNWRGNLMLRVELPKIEYGW